MTIVIALGLLVNLTLSIFILYASAKDNPRKSCKAHNALQDFTFLISEVLG